MTKIATALAVIGIAAVTPAMAGSITDGHLKLITMPGGTIIDVSDEIVVGDALSFERLADRSTGVVVVVLSSGGGALIEGLSIGESIKRRGFATLAAGKCYSTCAYAWLAGGANRGMMRNSEVVFHSPYATSDPEHADARGGVLVGQYLAEIGIDIKTTMAITGHGPNDYYSLTSSAVNPIISFKVIDDGDQQKPNAAQQQAPQRGTSPAAVPEVFAMYCYPKGGEVYGIVVGRGNGMAKVVSRTGKVRPYEVFEEKINEPRGIFYAAAKRTDQDRTLYFAFDYSKGGDDVSAIRVKAPGHDSRDTCKIDWTNTK